VNSVEPDVGELVAVPKRSYNARQRVFVRAFGEISPNSQMGYRRLLLIPLRHRERDAGVYACLLFALNFFAHVIPVFSRIAF